MNQIERVKAEVERRGLTATLDAPLRNRKGASWMLDVRSGDRMVVVEWRPRRGFGLTLATDDTGFGEGPDEIASSPAMAVSRVAQLIGLENPKRSEAAAPGEPISLGQLRKLRNLSQVELAKRLKVTQATVSELESKGIGSAAVSTVMRAVEALGMKLEIRAVRKDGNRSFVLRG